MIWDKAQRVDSSNKDVFKYVFTKGDAVAEAVLYKYPTFEERTVVCCSTQSGCPVGCRFCGAGDHFVRSLTADEIVSQTHHLFLDKGIDAAKVQRMQIMFMSMGEPLLNAGPLCEAIRKLHMLYPQARLLISTSAPRSTEAAWQDVMNVAEEVETVGLQFSVHESTDEARNKLIPLASKLTLAEMADMGTVFYAKTGRKPFFNYCVHEKNDKQEDVDRLGMLFDPDVFEATLSVVCERDEHVAAANARQRDLTAAFMEKMITAGYSTRMFDPAGQDDIGGGCGQLWFVQDWMKKHPELAKKSIGFGKEVVHTPR